MENSKILVKNITPIMRSLWHEATFYQFKVDESKLVPESFIDSDGASKYTFLKLVGFEREDGSLMEVKKIEEVKTISDALLETPPEPIVPISNNTPPKNQKYIYKVTKSDEEAINIVGTSIKEIAEKINVEPTKLAQAFTTKKEKLDNWNLERFETSKFDLVDGLIVAKPEV